MIYVVPDLEAPVRQGDIFTGLPRLEMSLDRVLVVGDDALLGMSWEEATEKGRPVAAVVGARPVPAIVMTQDCDARRAPDITLCEIAPFQEVEGKAKETSSPRSWARIITQHSQLNRKWFYLPPDTRAGFAEKMAANFMLTIRVRRVELEKRRRLRRARLNDEAEAHFRERIAEFYRRYPYDEWYALDRGEFESYRRDHPDAEPRPWQLPNA